MLGEHVARSRTTAGTVDRDAALTAYHAVRLSRGPARALPPRRHDIARGGELWHLDGVAREQRTVLLRARDTCDYSFLDWLDGPTALLADDEPALFAPIPLSSVETAGF